MRPTDMKEIRYGGRSYRVGWRKNLLIDGTAGRRRTGMLIYDPSDQDGTPRGQVRMFKVLGRRVARFKMDILFRANRWESGRQRIAEMQAAVEDYVKSSTDKRPPSKKPQPRPFGDAHEECMECGQTFRVVELHPLHEDENGPELVVGRTVCETPMERCCAYRSNCGSERRHGVGRSARPTEIAPPISKPTTVPPESPQSPWSILDEAIAVVAQREFRRLSMRLTLAEIANRVEKSVDCLGQYDDEWAAIFYLTWYQPRQINLVFSFLRQAGLPDHELAYVADRPPLHVVDLGCGAYAVQFALAMFTLMGRHARLPIRIHGIDPSRSMKEIGRKLWQEFGIRVNRHLAKMQPASPDTRTLARLRQRITSMSSRCHTYDSLAQCLNSHAGVQAVFGDCWLTSVHAAYHLPQDLRHAAESLAPNAILVTGDDKRACDLETVLGPIAGEQAGHRFKSAVVPPELRSHLVHTTKWRKALATRISSQVPGWNHCSASRLLQSEVEWDLRRNPIEQDEARFRGTFR